MRFAHIIEAVKHQPWFITSGGYMAVRDLLDRAMSGELKTGKSGALFEDIVRPRPELIVDESSGIATISIIGTVGQHLSNIEKSCGATDYEDVKREIGEAKARGAKGILYYIDSPGGMVNGAEECAKAIKNCGLPTVGFTDGMACSAGYYLISGCDNVVATSSSYTGNIGIICPWVDSSIMWSLEGLDFQPIVNEGADLKGAMAGPSLTDEQREFIQTNVNDAARMFHDHVLESRENLDSEVFRAGWYYGDEAKRLGLIDLVGSRKDAFSLLR